MNDPEITFVRADEDRWTTIPIEVLRDERLNSKPWQRVAVLAGAGITTPPVGGEAI